MLRSLLILFAPALLLIGCQNRYQTIYEAAKAPGTGYRPQDDTVIADASSGRPFSRLQHPGTYGIRLDYDLPPGQRGKQLLVTVQGNSRTNNAYSQGLIIVSASNAKKGQLAWERIFMRYQYTDLDRWCFFRDSIILQADYYGQASERLTVYTYLPQGEEKFDVDGLKITVNTRKAW